MAPDSSTDEKDVPKPFIVPHYLRAGVTEVKEGYPDASNEESAILLKHS